VAELDSGVVTFGLVSVVAVACGDRVEGDDQVPLAGCPGGQPPGAVSAGRPLLVYGREGESGPAGWVASVRRPSFPAFRLFPAVSLGLRFGASVADGLPVLVGDYLKPRLVCL